MNKFFNSLAVKNCIRRPARSIALTLLSLILGLTILGGTLLVSGLKSGLDSLESRLGADIMVVPYAASTKADLSNIILQGNPGYFYMDDSVLEKIKGLDGIGNISSQFFLASASSGCCSYKVQIIGFDPETDFTIQPWVQISYKDELKDMEVFVGNTLNAFSGDELTFYGTKVKVAGKLDKTGTYLDTAVYANVNTIKKLIRSAKESKIYDFGNVDPDKIVSCVLIDAADGYSAEEVANDINLHVRGVTAVQTQNMVSDVSGKLTGIADMASALIVVIWLLVLLILILAFSMSANERKKEFAVLRVLGASRMRLAIEILKESILTGLVGSTLGAVCGLGVMAMFSDLIEDSLNLPFLLPGKTGLAVALFGGIAFSVVAASVASAISAYRISHMDAAVILRGEN